MSQFVAPWKRVSSSSTCSLAAMRFPSGQYSQVTCSMQEQEPDASKCACSLPSACNRCWVCWFLSEVSAARRLCAARNSSSVLFFLFAAPLSCWRSCDASAPVAVSSRPPTRREHHYLAQLVCGVGLHRGRLCCRRGGGGRGVERDPCKLRNSPRLLRYHTCKNEKRLLVCSNGFC